MAADMLARHCVNRNGRCEKYEEWPLSFVSLIVALVSGFVILGAYYTFETGVLPLVLFLLIGLLNFAFACYATCRHCYYYGKRCYLAVGLVVPFITEKVEEPSTALKMRAWVIILIVHLVFPAIVIYFANSFPVFLGKALIVLAPGASALFLIHEYSCPRCKNTNCIGNSNRKH
ncbi:MAG: hypothetical protein KKD44_16750 [Proteobacteria bacterium]|nr:hypothetical protein [Pseudomonadota bacterium]